jgi:VanZ family protein
MRKRFGYASAIWTLIILILYGLPGYAVRYNEPFDLIRLDKLVHFSIFAAQSVLFGLWLSDKPRSFWMYAALVFPIIYGGVLEYFQSTWFIERTTDWADFVANVCGAIAGFISMLIINRRVKT